MDGEGAVFGGRPIEGKALNLAALPGLEKPSFWITSALQLLSTRPVHSHDCRQLQPITPFAPCIYKKTILFSKEGVLLSGSFLDGCVIMQGRQLHTRTHVYMHLCSGLSHPLATCHSLPRDHISEYLSRLKSAGCKCLHWQQRGPRDKGRRTLQNAKSQSAVPPRCQYSGSIWASHFFIFYSVSSSVRSQGSRAFL